MRRAVTPVIPTSMYRHFAIITLVLTAGLAMFAEGENREATAAPAAPVTLATAAPTAKSRPSPRWWDDEPEFDSRFGRPAEVAHSGGDGSEIAGVAQTKLPRRSAESAASLSEAERELLLAGLQDSATPAP